MAFVLCLDTVGRGNSLHLHVSKPPREGTLQHTFLRELELVGAPGDKGALQAAARPRAGHMPISQTGPWRP